MGNKIGVVLLSYDINIKHEEVKNALERIGYRNHYRDISLKKCTLPSTTMIHLQKRTDDALNDLEDICKKLSVELKNCVATLSVQVIGIVKKPERIFTKI